MARKPTYEELEQMVNLGCQQITIHSLNSVFLTRFDYRKILKNIGENHAYQNFKSVLS